MKRKPILIIVLIIPLFIYLSLHPIVVDLTSDCTNYAAKQDTVGKDVKIFDDMDFASGRWSAYIIISRDDNMNLSKKIAEGKILVTKNASILKELKDNVNYKFTGGDEATVENELIICNDSKVVFRSNIVMDEFDVGFQTRQYGFLKPDQPQVLIDILGKFERSYFPFLLLTD